MPPVPPLPPSPLALRTVLWLAMGIIVALCSCAAGQNPVDASAPAPVASPVAQTPAPRDSTSPPVVSVATDANDPAQARSTLQGTIEEAIGLLRSRDYRKILEQFVDPSDLAKLEAEEGGTESLTRQFADSDKPKILLDILTSIRGATPELSQDGDEATFHAVPSPGAPHGGEIRLHRVQGRWYLRN